jgi:hypothetical protein
MPEKSLNAMKLSNLARSLLQDADAEAAYSNAERDALAQATTAAPATADTTPISNEDLTPHQIAIKRTKTAKERLATAHEGWSFAAQALLKAGLIPSDDMISNEMQAFGDAICGRYAAARFLWRVLVDMPVEDWFGPREKFDATLRRLRTLKGLEGSLACWEKVVLELMDLVDGMTENVSEEVCQKVKAVLGKWRRGLPSKP